MRSYVFVIKVVAFFIVNLSVSAQSITTVAGGGSTLGDGGPATSAQIGYIAGVAVDQAGNLYIADVNNNRLRRVDVNSSLITTIAGNGTAGFSGDGGPAMLAQLNLPEFVACGYDGSIYFSDVGNRRIRKITPSGTITTVCGNGTMAFAGDGGAATLASIHTPQGLEVAPNGDLYFVDMGAQRIRKINGTGIVESIAGNGVAGFSGDGGAATLAKLNAPRDIAFDTSGDLYIADVNNNRIRKVDKITGNIVTIAGNTTSGGYSGEGLPAIASDLGGPYGISFDKANNLFIAEKGNQRVREVSIDGLIHTVAGTGTTGFSGDGGAATAANLYYPMGVVLDACDNAFVADQQNRRIRKIAFNLYSIPTVAATGPTSTAIGSTVTVNATVSGVVGSYSIKWFKNSSLFSTTTVPTVNYTKGAGTDTITARVVPAASYCSDSATSAPHLVAASGVGVDDVMSDAGLRVYPSPARAVLHVSAGMVLRHIEVTNLLGQTMIDVAPQDVATDLDVSNLSKGVYLIRVNDVWVRRFVKE